MKQRKRPQADTSTAIEPKESDATTIIATAKEDNTQDVSEDTPQHVESCGRLSNSKDNVEDVSDDTPQHGEHCERLSKEIPPLESKDNTFCVAEVRLPNAPLDIQSPQSTVYAAEPK